MVSSLQFLLIRKAWCAYFFAFALFGAHRTAVVLAQVDRGMMDELKQIKQVVNPTEVLLVVDAMTGQEAAGTKHTSVK